MADLRAYARGRGEWRILRTILVLVVLASFFTVQIAAAVSSHPDHEGPNDHCCAACHGAHYPVLQTDTFVHVAQFTVAGWQHFVEDQRPISREWNAVNSSRAPPA